MLNFFHLLPKVIFEFTLLRYQFILSANARCASERTFSFTFVTISDEVEAFFEDGAHCSFCLSSILLLYFMKMLFNSSLACYPKAPKAKRYFTEKNAMNFKLTNKSKNNGVELIHAF